MDSQEALDHARAIADTIMAEMDYDVIESVATANVEVFIPFLMQQEKWAQDAKELSAWVFWEVKSRWLANAQKRALPLLRSYLTPYQRAYLRKHITFPVIGSAGGRYMLAPHYTAIQRTLPRGPTKANRVVIRYCYHDPEGIMCYADNMLGVMFKLMTDEPGFLLEANATVNHRYRNDPEVLALLVEKPVDPDMAAEIQAIINEGSIIVCHGMPDWA